jgi:hypothetical protein
MMIDLNGNDFGGSNAIFNNGVAGVTRDVEINVEKRGSDVPETYPDFKVEVIDDAGGKINAGFYYFKPNPQADTEYNKKRETQEVSRVLHLAKAVMGSDYIFPAVNSAKEAYDVLFKLVADNTASKKFTVFTTYGTIARPNKKGYMGLRYFNFIEPTGESTRFRVGPQDLMSRVEPDTTPTTGDGSSAKTESWV